MRANYNMAIMRERFLRMVDEYRLVYGGQVTPLWVTWTRYQSRKWRIEQMRIALFVRAENADEKRRARLNKIWRMVARLEK